MRRFAIIAVLLAVLGVSVSDTGAQTLTGTIQGAITDQQGAVLPGVTVTLTGRTGSQTAVTDGRGEYRFVGLNPGDYVVRAELAGFLTQELKVAGLGIGKTLSTDFTLSVGGLAESVQVVGDTMSIDTRSAATDTGLSQDLLFTAPIYDSTSTGLMNYAPGVNNSSAYGGQGSYGNALLLDGVDTRDPEGGSAWTFFDQNLIQEIEIGGLGAPAEYGGFSGAIVNTVTKSGGNMFSGLFNVRYTNDGLASNNISSEIATANGSLTEADVTTKLVDYTVQLGGPIKRDKAFFFGSIQRYSEVADPSGPKTKRTEISPRFTTKLTLQPSSGNTVMLGLQYDQYNIKGRDGYPGTASTDSQTVTEDAPEWVWNAQWRKVFGASTFLEAKFTGYSGYYYLDPVDPSPFTYDGDSGEYTGGGGNLYYADRSRNQLNVALTQYADKFGKHSFKFGMEIERAHVRSQYQPYGPAGFYIYAYGGVPYYQISYGYDFQGDNHRESIFAQDQWTAGKLTANIGLRLDRIRGYSPVLKDTVYSPDLGWGPRLGVAYDLTGKGTSVVKGFWGHYFEGPGSAFFTAATPGQQDYVSTPILANGKLGTPDVQVPGISYEIADNIKHPRVQEFNVSFEQQLSKAWRVTATGIWRSTTNFVNNVIDGARFQAVTLTNQLTGQPMTGYRWANSAATAENFLIRNQKGFQYLATDGSVIGTADPQRKYKGMMLVVSKALRDRWSFQGSYVLAKSEGNVENGVTDSESGFGAWLGGVQWDSPNTALTNRIGELIMSRRHELKVYGSYQIPKIDVLISPSYTGLSGRPYTPYQQFTQGQLGLPSASRRRIFLEPRGSRRRDFYHQVDLRLEKVLTVGVHRLGAFVDFFNLFNTDTITGVQTRVPSTSIAGSTVLFGGPTAVQSARQIYIGGRWSF